MKTYCRSLTAEAAVRGDIARLGLRGNVKAVGGHFPGRATQMLP